MELVYLWIEDYKNIKKQGFNFSARFECEYDENTKELTKIRDDSETYKSIFPDKINITAIVGENGSGKSNILEILSDYNLNNNTVIKVFHHNNEFLYKINNNTKINTLFTESNLDETTVLYTEIPSENALNNNNIRNISLWNNFQKNEYSTYDNLNIIKNKMQTSHMILMKKYDFLPGINKKPKYIEFSFNHYYFDNIQHDNRNQIWINIFKILINRDYNKYKEGIDIDEYLAYDYEDLTIKEVKNFISEKIDDDDTLNWVSELLNLSDKFIRNYNLICNSKVEYQEQIIPKFKKGYEEDDEDIYDDYNNKIRTFKLYIKFENFEEKFLTSIENLFSYSREELIINLKWDITLSTGEESFLNLFASLYNCIKTYSYTFEHINIVIDEIEAYLHPNWQIQFVDLLIKFFNLDGIKYKSKTNIILTSHSPFILSDLPKENVIFLENGKQVYPFKDNQQAFGANIHTLLSHGFFMKDGLMGEFAKSKIDDVIKYLNNGKNTTINDDKNAQNIISIIGEPIIKRELQRMLKNKMELSNKTEIDTIKEEIKELTEKLEKLEGKK